MEGSSDIRRSESLDDGQSFLDMELEALQSIFINELEVTVDDKYTTVSIDLHPSTADKLDEQYVRMTLQLLLKEEYPEIIPDIKIRNPRGLSEEKIICIEKDLLMIAESKKGSSMLFEMIDTAKEHLTVGNRPSGECAICLYGFRENDVFTKTECYHYFHSHCLARYARNFIENSNDSKDDERNKTDSSELLCPMCRIPIEFNEKEADYIPPEECEDDFVLTDEMAELQRKMADLYQKQVEKGGIIDVEAEKNKYLLEISHVPTRMSSDEKSEQRLLTTEDDSATDSKVEPSDDLDSPSNERRQVRDRNQRYDYRGRNRNFNKPSENRGNYRSDHRHNKHSYENYRGNYNRNRYGKQNSGGSYKHREEGFLPPEASRDSTESCGVDESEDPSQTQDVQDDISEGSEKDQERPDVKSRHSSNFSPRYNRGPRRGGNHYGGYNSNRRFDKSSYHERHGSQTSRRYNPVHGVDQSAGNSEERGARDARPSEEEDRRSNYRSGSYKRDEDYNARQRYSDRNSQRGYNKGAYGRRDNYAHNNYSRNSRYSDARDRDHYHTDRDRNFREKRTYRGESRPQAGENNAHDGYNKQSFRNYTGNRPRRYADKVNNESSNNESESVELSSHSSDHKTVEKENGAKRCVDSTERESDSLQKKEAISSAEKCSDKLTDPSTSLEGSGPKAFKNSANNIPQITSRTVNPPPGFANPHKKVIYGLQGANPPPGFNKS